MLIRAEEVLHRCSKKYSKILENSEENISFATRIPTISKKFSGNS